MYEKTDTPQWSVHAEFTISHPGMGNNIRQPETRTERNDDAVRMTCSWSSEPPTNATNSWTTLRNYPPAFGVPKGKPVFLKPDSGYSSELLSPNSSQSQTVQKRPQLPYDRRCRSTCNIVLTAEYNDGSAADGNTVQCGRTQSLRCQKRESEKFYGCGDPWCHHGSVTPVEEEREATGKIPARAQTFTPGCKDASVQTFEMIDKCTSPYMKSGEFRFADEDPLERGNKKKYGRRRTDPIFQRIYSPSTYTPDSLDSQQSSRRRSPKAKSTVASVLPKQDSTSDSKSGSLKKPRTVHIDVYCTGTDLESSGSTSDSDTGNKSASTPQTVFENQKMRVVHKRANSKELPFNLKTTIKEETPVVSANPQIKKEPQHQQSVESDVEDNTSTAYPSQLSSFATFRDLESSISSVPPSWSTYSMTSSRDYDSVANTSWKDTFSDVGSLLQSRSSLAATESLDFVPRKASEVPTTPTISETPESTGNLLEAPSTTSVQLSDSFEYANSEDRVRIKRMEEMLKGESPARTWRSPQLERRHMLQQKKIREYLDRKSASEVKETKESESDTDSDEKGWTFVKSDQKKLGRDETVRRTSRDSMELKRENVIPEEEKNGADEGNGVSFMKSPSTVALRQRLIQNPNLRAPFTIVPGIYTDQRFIARKFGAVVPVFRKPGHHIGPAKNPECLCDHCKRHFEDKGRRTRASSFGEYPMNSGNNWKEMFRYSSIPRERHTFAEY